MKKMFLALFLLTLVVNCDAQRKIRKDKGSKHDDKFKEIEHEIDVDDLCPSEEEQYEYGEEFGDRIYINDITVKL
jgi:hypothetical protein